MKKKLVQVCAVGFIVLLSGCGESNSPVSRVVYDGNGCYSFKYEQWIPDECYENYYDAANHAKKFDAAWSAHKRNQHKDWKEIVR
jgi:hypothetical protein